MCLKCTQVRSRGGICPSRQCRRQCKIFASGINFSIFTHFFCFFLLKLLKLGVKFLAWKSGGVKFWTNSMSDLSFSICHDLSTLPQNYYHFHFPWNGRRSRKLLWCLLILSSDLLCKSLDFHSYRPKELLLLIDRTFVGKTLDFDCANIEHCKLGKERQSLGLLLLGVIFAT